MTAYCSTPVTLKLALGSVVLDLMDQANGFRVAEIDLGYPDIREDSNARAVQHGMMDFTQFFGARAVTISGSVIPSAAGSRQKVLHALAPFLDPAARPVLTYQIDADTSPRTITLRASELSVPFNHPQVSDWSVGWKAPDPLAYDANIQLTIAGVSIFGGGRQYNLVFNRVYPAGTGGTGVSTNNGDFTVYPLLRVYGPITGANIQWTPSGQNGQHLFFALNYTINAGHYVEVDCKRRTAFLDGDPSQSVYPQISFSLAGSWPVLPPGVRTFWTMQGSNTNNSSQLQVQWQDAYLI
jgi:hypothetical protein